MKNSGCDWLTISQKTPAPISRSTEILMGQQVLQHYEDMPQRIILTAEGPGVAHTGTYVTGRAPFSRSIGLDLVLYSTHTYTVLKQLYYVRWWASHHNHEIFAISLRHRVSEMLLYWQLGCFSKIYIESNVTYNLSGSSDNELSHKE